MAHWNPRSNEMMKMRRVYQHCLAALSVGALSLATLCVGGVGGFGISAALADGAAHAQMEAAPADFGKPGDPAKVSRTVTVKATEIAYDVGSLTFKAGETVRFVFINRGEQDHEFVIADAATQQAHREMMMSMPDMDHGQMQGHDDADAPPMLMLTARPGETKEMVWTFTRPATLEFACNIPGHAEAGMEGKLIVK